MLQLCSDSDRSSSSSLGLVSGWATDEICKLQGVVSAATSANFHLHMQLSQLSYGHQGGKPSFIMEGNIYKIKDPDQQRL